MITYSKTNDFSSEEDAVILDAIDYGHLSHARVQTLLKSTFGKAALLIDSAIEKGCFDKNQRPLIAKSEYQRIIEEKT